MPAKTYRIETDRLVIRCYQPTDAVLLKQAIDESLDHLRPWMPWAMEEPETVEEKVARLRRFRGQFDLGNDYIYGIFNKDEDEQVGSTGLHTRAGDGAREIGYWIASKHTKKGYAQEAAMALTKVGFEIEELDRIDIHCASNNVRSQHIPKTLGYVHEGTLRDRSVDSYGKPRDVMIWTMFREDYLKTSIMEMDIKAFGIVGDALKMGAQD